MHDSNYSLPTEFVEYTQSLFGCERWQHYVDAFSQEAPASIRINPLKAHDIGTLNFGKATTEPVPWCRSGYYLSERPDFTLDPLLHAGAYYVQEASSMFLDEVVRQLMPELPQDGGVALDLCASPGGKSTLLRAALPEGCTLYSNEPDHKRANILMENLQKQGFPRVIVTNNYAKDYARSGLVFDFVLCDVPCSGEGMFRKDVGAIGEWSLQNVMKCQALQRSIVEDIWPQLKPGGIMVYSTCTFNTRENEENVRWIVEQLGADIVKIDTAADWGITGSLLAGWHEQVYRFIPGTTKGEGLFMAVLRKAADAEFHVGKKTKKGQSADSGLRILHSSTGCIEGTRKGKDIIPAHAEALSVTLEADKYPRAELTRDDALRYLRRETITLPADTPRGYIVVTYHDMPLGFVKNIGNRANNLYPQEWRIRKNFNI